MATTLTPYMADGEVQFEPVYDEAMRHAELLKPMMADVSRELNEAHLHGANLLFEGAQGTLLDVDHGTYPYRDLQQLRGRQCRRRLPASARACCTTSWASPRPTAPAWAAARSRPSWNGKRKARRAGT